MWRKYFKHKKETQKRYKYKQSFKSKCCLDFCNKKVNLINSLGYCMTHLNQSNRGELPFPTYKNDIECSRHSTNLCIIENCNYYRKKGFISCSTHYYKLQLYLKNKQKYEQIQYHRCSIPKCKNKVNLSTYYKSAKYRFCEIHYSNRGSLCAALSRNRNKKQARTTARKRIKERLKNPDFKRKFRIIGNLRTRLGIAIKQHRTIKISSHIKDLGCSIEELIKHLEAKFKPGMTWDNYGVYGWHIDHIYPLSRVDFNNKKEIAKACHYTNLQPMWAEDNIRKSNYIIE